MKEEIEKVTITVEKFNMLLSVTDINVEEI